MNTRSNKFGRHPTGLGEVLKSIGYKKNWRTKMALHEVFRFWDEAVGIEIGHQAQPDLIRGRVLWVRVSDSMWMQHLHLNKIMLLERLNRQLNGVAIEDIRFRIDTSLGGPMAHPKEAPPAAPPDRGRLRHLEQLVAVLPDPDLRASLRNLWLTYQGNPNDTTRQAK